MDLEKITWLCIYIFSCHAWNSQFFEFIIKLVGIIMCSYDGTRDHSEMDVARLSITTNYVAVLNDMFNVKINGEVFRLNVVKDAHGHLRINMLALF